jgi:hypothetical protein
MRCCIGPVCLDGMPLHTNAAEQVGYLKEIKLHDLFNMLTQLLVIVRFNFTFFLSRCDGKLLSISPVRGRLFFGDK